jgi:3-methyladenine DNA glycosylase/8-oxoguanine DNA glycosylase
VIEVRRSVRPPWPFRLPGGGADGVLRRRGRVLERLLHVGDAPVVVRVAQAARDEVLFGAWAAVRDAAEEAIARMRFALGVDDDLREFHARHRHDPLIGPSVRARPWLRVARRPDPFEALAWAICEQLIDFEQAVGIQRRIVARLGRCCPASGLRDLPSAASLAAIAPAQLQALDLSAGRALALRRAAREVAAGRADLRAADHERAWRRLRAIPGIGSWTLEMLALHGQGRYDRLPAGDLNLLKLVGRLQSGGDPWARATEHEVRAVFARFDGWAGLAAAHALRRQPAMVSTTLPVARRSRSAASAAAVSPQSASTPRGTVSRPSATRPASTPRSRPNVSSPVL